MLQHGAANEIAATLTQQAHETSTSLNPGGVKTDFSPSPSRTSETSNDFKDKENKTPKSAPTAKRKKKKKPLRNTAEKQVELKPGDEAPRTRLEALNSPFRPQ